MLVENILYFPSVPSICIRFLPLFELGHRVKGLLHFRIACSYALFRLEHLYNGRNELFQEAELEQIRPLMMNKVYDQAFDVRAVVILIGHDHNFAISK